MQDPYDLLGVRRSDTDETIRKAYRKLAKRHHPDVNPGNPEAAERFKQISVAYGLLSDPDKRARFDRGEIDADGHERAPPRAREAAWQGGGSAGPGPFGGAADASGFDFENLEELFGSHFNRSGAAGKRPRQGADVQYSLTIPFMEAIHGGVRRLSLAEGKSLDVTIPPGLRDGHVLRLRGQAMPGVNGGSAGDALVEISVAPHAYFRREGDDIVLRLPISLQEAVLGGPVDVPTLTGRVKLTVPANAADGMRLRLKGRGVGKGDQYVELAVVLPTQPEPALTDFLKTWKPEHPMRLRDELERP